MTDWGPLFSHQPEKPEHEEQREQLARVSGRISAAIKDFCRQHTLFHAEELRAYVDGKLGAVAPGSVDRVLRHLRQIGEVPYIVRSRRESLYEVLPAGVSP